MPVTGNNVGIGETRFAGRGALICLAVGSCVALALVNVRTGQAGMAHIFLPRAPSGWDEGGGKYADVAVAGMAARLGGAGALNAYLAGGARMFPAGFRPAGAPDVGALNAEATVAALNALGIPILFSDLGGTSARNVTFDITARVMTSRTGAAKRGGFGV